VNGGLSNVLLVHPSIEPSTKLDGSFISYVEKYQEKTSGQVLSNSYNPHSIKWNYLMISCSYIRPPFYCIRVCKIRKCGYSWPNLGEMYQ
jgi:hypothetical protein